MNIWKSFTGKAVACIFISVLSSSLSGCKHGFKIYVESEPEIVFRIAKSSLMSFGDICITELQVYDDAGNGAMWSIQSIDRKCLSIDTVRYGLVPRGFIEDGELHALKSKGKYTVDAEGYGWSGTTKFQLP